DNPSPEPTPSVPQPGKGSIEMAVGTFKGQMTVFRAEGGDEDYYDAVVVVTKVGAEQLKAEAKSGEAYSDASPKTFKVTVDGMGMAVSAKTGSPEGSFLYISDGR